MNNSRKIAVIDDDPVIVQGIMTVLELDNYRVLPIVEAAEAEGIVQKEKPDLIFLDVKLDKRDGRQIARTLKNNPLTAHIPIIIISSDPEYEDYVFRCGADAFLAKPFSIAEMLEKAKKFLFKPT